MTTSTETMTTSTTGGMKAKKPQQISTIDPKALLMLAEVSAFGAEKYDAYNYLKGYDWDLSYDAAQRHLMQFWNGEDRDEESGLLHVLHAAWHCLAMASFIERGLGTDTRYRKVESKLEALRRMLTEPTPDYAVPVRYVAGIDPVFNDWEEVVEEPAFEVGERVYVTYGYGWDGYAEVFRIEGTSVSVRYDDDREGGFQVNSLMKVEDFSIIGAYVADDEGLDALPYGSVIRIEGRVPTVKLRTGWDWAGTASLAGLDRDAMTRNAVASRGAIVVFDGNVDGPY